MKKFVLGCLGGAVFIMVVLVGLVWFWLFHESPMLDATLSLPNETRLEAPMTMVVTASNPHQKAITLDSIDVDDAFLAGFQVLRIDPAPLDTFHVPILNQRTWNFEKSIQPGESLSVTFSLKSVAEGHFSGDIDVCNPNQDFKTLLADVVVKREIPNGFAPPRE